MDENTGVTWHQGATFVASDANAEKSFGPALANSGNTLVVGSPGSPSPDPFHPIPVMRSDSGTPANSLDANAERDLVSTWPAGFQSGFDNRSLNRTVEVHGILLQVCAIEVRHVLVGREYALASMYVTTRMVGQP